MTTVTTSVAAIVAPVSEIIAKRRAAQAVLDANRQAKEAAAKKIADEMFDTFFAGCIVPRMGNLEDREIVRIDMDEIETSFFIRLSGKHALYECQSSDGDFRCANFVAAHRNTKGWPRSYQCYFAHTVTRISAACKNERCRWEYCKGDFKESYYDTPPQSCTECCIRTAWFSVARTREEANALHARITATKKEIAHSDKRAAADRATAAKRVAASHAADEKTALARAVAAAEQVKAPAAE